MQTTFDATVSITGTALPDFKSAEVSEQVGISEQSFVVNVDRPVSVTTDDTLTISYSIGGGGTYVLVDGKKIEIVEPSTNDTTMRGAGSLLTRYGSSRTVIWVNQTWLSSAYPKYVLRDGIIYDGDPGTNPVKYKGVSTKRLFVPELPGKDVKDFDFTCIVQPGISYHTIAQYIGQKTGYQVYVTCPSFSVQKTWMLGVDEPYFSALARLYSIFNPMMYIKDNVIYILDIGGDAQDFISGTPTIKLSEQSFSLLKYNIADNQEVVDHVLLVGPSNKWIYNYNTSLSTARIHRSESSLPGEELTLVYEGNFETDSAEYLSILQKELSRSGESISAETVFEHTNFDVDKNGRYVRTVKMKFDYFSNASAVTEENIKIYNLGGDLVSETDTKNRWADFQTPLGHTTIEYARLGVVQGDTTEQNVSGYKNVIPQSYEFVPLSAEVVVFGDFIGETGQYDIDIDIYNKVAYIKDEDTVDTGGGTEEDVYIRKRPQIVSRNSLIGTTPYTWEPNEDDATLGWQNGFMLTRREKIRFDRASSFLLRKIRTVEEFLPLHSVKIYPEDVPLKRRQIVEDMVTTKWEFFCLNGNPDSIYQWDGTGNLPTPTPGGPGVVAGQPASFHPMLTVSCPDLVDDQMARRIARRIFHKHQRKNTHATIRTTVPIPGVRIGSIFEIPACTKEYFNWDTKVWTSVTLDAKVLWVTGVRTVISFEGDKGKSFREAHIYTEFDLKEKF